MRAHISATVLACALAVALFACAHASTRPADEPLPAEDILDQVQFPPPDPLGWLPEIDQLGNVLLSVEVDAVVTYDGGPDGPAVAGMDIRGSRCARSVYAVMNRVPAGEPWSVICLPREFGLYERVNGREPPGSP